MKQNMKVEVKTLVKQGRQEDIQETNSNLKDLDCISLLIANLNAFIFRIDLTSIPKTSIYISMLTVTTYMYTSPSS